MAIPSSQCPSERHLDHTHPLLTRAPHALSSRAPHIQRHLATSFAVRCLTSSAQQLTARPVADRLEWSELKKMYLDEKWGAEGSGGWGEAGGAQGSGGWGEAESEQWAAASNSWAQDAAPKKVPAPAGTQQVLVVLTCSCVSGAGRGRQSAMVAYYT